MTDPNEPKVSLSSESLNFLKESGGWSAFLAIVGFCFAALFIIFGLFAGAIMKNMFFGTDSGMDGLGTAWVGGVYIFAGGLYMIPTFYLYRFSQEIKNALVRNSTEAMTAAMGNLKSLLKFMGIFTVIYLVIVVLGLLAVGATGLFM